MEIIKGIVKDDFKNDLYKKLNIANFLFHISVIEGTYIQKPASF